MKSPAHNPRNRVLRDHKGLICCWYLALSFQSSYFSLHQVKPLSFFIIIVSLLLFFIIVMHYMIFQLCKCTFAMLWAPWFARAYISPNVTKIGFENVPDTIGFIFNYRKNAEVSIYGS